MTTMTDTPKKVRRRRSSQVPGSDFTRAEHNVAQALHDTFNIERHRHTSNQRVQADIGKARMLPNDLKKPLRVGESRTESIEDPGKGQKDAERWLSLARQIVALRFDPEHYVRWHFRQIPPNARPLLPNQLGSAAALATYEQAIGSDDMRDEIMVAFFSQNETFQREATMAFAMYASRDDAWISVLVNDEIGLSALFRYCLARDIANKQRNRRFLDVASAYKRAAAVQYVRHADVYDEVWGDKWIPAKFRREAQKIYHKVYFKS